MGYRLDEASNPVPVEIVDNVIKSDFGIFKNGVKIPINTVLNFPKQCNMFKNPDIMVCVYNTDYRLLIRFDGVCVLTTIEGYHIANFKVSSEHKCFYNTYISGSLCVNADYTKWVTRVIEAEDKYILFNMNVPITIIVKCSDLPELFKTSNNVFPKIKVNTLSRIVTVEDIKTSQERVLNAELLLAKGYMQLGGVMI